MVIDLPSDNGLVHLHGITRVLDLPEFVKQADVTQQIEVNQLPKESFADPANRKFPVHTKVAAYLAYAYYQTQRDGMDKRTVAFLDNQFSKVASFWNIKAEYKSINDAYSKATEKVAAESAYALQIGVEKFFPINTPSEILKSAEELVANRSMLTYNMRREAATSIMKAAAAANINVDVLPNPVHSMAGFGLTTKTAAINELAYRINVAGGEAVSKPVNVCIQALGAIKSDILGGEVAVKLASILDELDRSARLTDKYGEQLPFPEDVLFGFTKVAAVREHNGLVSMVDGTTYKLADMQKAASAFLVLGDMSKDVFNGLHGLELHKVADFVATLPRTDAEVLKSALDTAGVHPVKSTKEAMVKAAVDQVTSKYNRTFVTYNQNARAEQLKKAEASDVLVKRAMDVVRRLKVAKCHSSDNCDEGAEDKKSNKKTSPVPRGVDGLFIRRAPNGNSTTSCTKE